MFAKGSGASETFVLGQAKNEEAQGGEDPRLRCTPFLSSRLRSCNSSEITDLHEMIAAVIRSALVDEALGSGLRARLDDMKERLWRLEVRASKKRELALQAMSKTGLTKLEQPDFTASTRAGVPALVVVSEQAIPEAYWLTQPPKLDCPGLELSNPKPILMVRTK